MYFLASAVVNAVPATVTLSGKSVPSDDKTLHYATLCTYRHTNTALFRFTEVVRSMCVLAGPNVIKRPVFVSNTEIRDVICYSATDLHIILFSSHMRESRVGFKKFVPLRRLTDLNCLSCHFTKRVLK